MPSPEAPTIPHWFKPGDPWLTDKMRQAADITGAEIKLGEALERALAVYLDEARARVLADGPAALRAAATPDLANWPERERGWLAAVADFVYAVLRAVFGKRFQAEVSDLSSPPSPDTAATAYTTAVWDRLKLFPEIVLEEVRTEISAATAVGDSAARIEQRVSALLQIDAPSRAAAREADLLVRTINDPKTTDPVRRQARSRLAAVQAKPGTRWFGKVRELARTLAVSVLNAATWAAAAAYSHLTRQKRWQQWWTVHDDRVRESHRHADGQARPVGEKFLVGGYPMAYPGDPSAPPDQTTNCRCSLLSLSAADGKAARTAYEQRTGRAITAASDPRGGVGMGNAVLTEQDTIEQVVADLPPDTVSGTDDPGAQGDPVEPPVLAAGTKLPASATSMGWCGVLAPMGVRSGDKRMLAPSPGVPNHRTLPLPLLYQPSTAPGHDNSVVVGNIQRVWSQDGQLMGSGLFDLGSEAGREAVRQIDGGFMRWVSVALDDDSVQMQYYGPDGAQLTPMQVALAEDDQGIDAVRVYTAWRLMSATLVAEPAFQEACIVLVDPADLIDPNAPDDPDDDEDDPTVPPPAPQVPAPPGVPPGVPQAVSAAGSSGPSAKDRKKAEADGDAMPGGRYPVTDKASLQKAIKAVGRAGGPNGTEADRTAVRRYIIAQAKKLGLSNLIPFYWAPDGSLRTGKKKAKAGMEGVVLTADAQGWYQQVAEAVPMEPPAAWFGDPELTGPTKIKVTDAGRIYGHIAAWNSRHAAMPGVVPPHNPDTAYTKFHRHPVRTAEGTRVKTGPLAGSGHADIGEREIWAVQRHYDDPAFVLADVVVGEDQYGLWCSGSLRHGVTPYQVMFADRYSFSGDWRGGELLAACLASVPGFHLDADESVEALAASAGGEAPTPMVWESAPRFRVEDGEVVALVAAGMIAPEPEVSSPGALRVAVDFAPDPEEWGRRIGHGFVAGRQEAEQELAAQREYEREQVALQAQYAALAARITAPRAQEIARLAARIGVKAGV